MDGLKVALGSLLRHGLTVLGGVLVAHGMINNNGAEQIVSAGMVLGGVAWSVWTGYGRVIVIAKLEDLKEEAEAKIAARKASSPSTPASAAALILAIAAAVVLAPIPGQAQASPQATRVSALVAPSKTTVATPTTTTGDSLLNEKVKDAVNKLLADFTAAKAVADAGKDTSASTCWGAMVTYLQGMSDVQATTAVPTVHAVTAFTRLRLVKLAFRDGSDIRKACSALVDEEKSDIKSILLKAISAGVATSEAASLIAVLGL
jgi:hypothetical protein